jgi:hypothetical protein
MGRTEVHEPSLDTPLAVKRKGLSVNSGLASTVGREVIVWEEAHETELFSGQGEISGRLPGDIGRRISCANELETMFREVEPYTVGAERGHRLRGWHMRRLLLVGLIAVVASISVVAAASAQSGHFVGTVTCTDTGTTLTCSGKVAGLGGTTFEIRVAVSGATADTECTNPGGNVAPGQDFTFAATGSGGPEPTPRNGSTRFTVSTADPTAPAGSCPNSSWTADVIDVDFSGKTATVTLLEDNVPSDSVQVSIP